MNDNDVNLSGLVNKLGLNRRQFLAATTGMAAAAAVTASPAHWLPRPATRTASSSRRPRRGIILYTVRDAIGRDPADVGPTPRASRRSSKELATIGYRQIEFAGYSQNANSDGWHRPQQPWRVRPCCAPGSTTTGSRREGNHGSVPGTVTDATIAAFDTACEIANILGLGHIGTGSDPTGSAFVADWEARCRALELLRRAGRRPTGSSSTPTTTTSPTASCSTAGRWTTLGRPTRPQRHPAPRVLPREHRPEAYVYLEMDIYWAHVAQYKHRTYTAPDGSVGGGRSSTRRPWSPRRPPASRCSTPRTGRSDTSVANGYVMTPFGEGDIDYSTFLRSAWAPRATHNPMWEQDTAPGGTAAPGQSLEFAKLSYDNMAALRG